MKDTTLNSPSIPPVPVATTSPATPPVIANPDPQSIPSSTATQIQYAGFWRRWSAYFVDGFILSLLVSALSFVFLRATYQNGNFSVNYIPGVLIAFAYHAFFWIQQDGQTIGKRLARIKVIRQDNKPIDLTTAITRYIGYLISGAVLCLGYLSIAFSKQKLGWHDRLARTYVVSVGKTRKSLIVLIVIFIFLLVTIFGASIAVGIAGFKHLKKIDVTPSQLMEQLEEIDQSDFNFDQDAI